MSHITEEYERNHFLIAKGWYMFLLFVTFGKIIMQHLMVWEMKQNLHKNQNTIFFADESDIEECSFGTSGGPMAKTLHSNAGDLG